jgi:hypothetical protein
MGRIDDASNILKNYEDDNEYHFHEVDRKWIIEAMIEFSDMNVHRLWLEQCEGKETPTGNSNCIKPAVSNSLPDIDYINVTMDKYIEKLPSLTAQKWAMIGFKAAIAVMSGNDC